MTKNNTDGLVKAISKPTKKKPAKPWYQAVANVVWESRPVKWLCQATVIACVAYTSLNLATNLTGLQQIQGAVSLVIVSVVINRAFRK